MWWNCSIFCNKAESEALTDATRMILQPVYLAASLFTKNSRNLNLITVSKHYNDLDRIAEHEAVPHPVGELFTVYRDHEIHLFAGAGEATIHEKSTEDGNHTVSTCYGGQASETRLSICTSHNLTSNDVFKANYTTDLRRDAYCNIHARHKFGENSILCSLFQEGWSNEPVLEVEIQQMKKKFQTTGKMEKNLANGHHQLMLQSNVNGPTGILLRNTAHTNLRGDGSFAVELLSSSDSPCISSRFAVGENGSKELSLHGSKNVCKTILLDASAFTNFNSNQHIRFEAKHKIDKAEEIAIRFKSDFYNINEINFHMLRSYNGHFWNFKYRKQNEDGHWLGLDWSQKWSCNFYSLKIESNTQNFNIYGDMCYNFK